MSFLFGLLGGFVAWIATTFFAHPLTNFYNLRGRAAEALARYEDRFNLEFDDSLQSDGNWIVDRRAAYETCGSSLLAFATSNRFVTKCLYRMAPRNCRYYVQSAGSNLMTLARVNPGTQAAKQLHEKIVSALKLNYGPSAKRRPGKNLLIAGVIVYLAVFLFLFGFMSPYSRLRKDGIEVLIAAPFAIAGISLLLGWISFWIGTITGTPLVSFIYGFSEIKRVWRGVIGYSLLMAAALALAVVIWPYLPRI
jgi:hypothetical protein